MRIPAYFRRRNAAPAVPGEVQPETAAESAQNDAPGAADEWTRFNPLEPRFVALLARLDQLSHRA